MEGSTPWDTAKYGAYTMFCCAIAKIVHFELVQVCFNYNVLFAIAKGEKRAAAFTVASLEDWHKKKLFSTD